MSGTVWAPILMLLHGFPASSFMFRNLIPALSDQVAQLIRDFLGWQDLPA